MERRNREKKRWREDDAEGKRRRERQPGAGDSGTGDESDG